jgi:hypothetical protein
MGFAVEFSSDLTLAVSNTCKRSVEYRFSRHSERNYVILSYMDPSNSCDILHVWDTEFDLYCNVVSCLCKLNVGHAATRLLSAPRNGHSSLS